MYKERGRTNLGESLMGGEGDSWFDVLAKAVGWGFMGKKYCVLERTATEGKRRKNGQEKRRVAYRRCILKEKT